MIKKEAACMWGRRRKAEYRWKEGGGGMNNGWSPPFFSFTANTILPPYLPFQYR